MNLGYVKFSRKSDGAVVSSKTQKAISFTERLLGLIPRKNFSSDEGLWFPNCNSAHSFFMSFPIDLILLDKKLSVVATKSLKPWRMTKLYWKADSMLEVSSGTIERLSIICGDQLEMQNV